METKKETKKVINKEFAELYKQLFENGAVPCSDGYIYLSGGFYINEFGEMVSD